MTVSCSGKSQNGAFRREVDGGKEREWAWQITSDPEALGAWVPTPNLAQASAALSNDDLW